MTYRLIQPDEWERLRPLFEKHGQRLPPSPETGLPIMAAVAEDAQGEIRGLMIFQPAFHAEPLILDDPYVNFLSLWRTLRQPLEDKHGLGYYVFTDQDVTDGMAKLGGMQRLPVNVWKGEIP